MEVRVEGAQEQVQRVGQSHQPGQHPGDAVLGHQAPVREGGGEDGGAAAGGGGGSLGIGSLKGGQSL